jgi:uncharacterized protein (DUF1778 family)
MSKTEERLAFRCAPSVKQQIERAAAIRHQTLTNFALDALQREADRTIEDEERRIISNRDRALFLAMLDDTTGPNEALKQAAERYKQRRSEA